MANRYNGRRKYKFATAADTFQVSVRKIGPDNVEVKLSTGEMMTFHREGVTDLWVLHRGNRGTLVGTAIGAAIDAATVAFLMANSPKGLGEN